MDGADLARVPVRGAERDDPGDAMSDALREARARVADGSISDLETPALLRRLTGAHLDPEAIEGTPFEAPAPLAEPVPGDFVLVDLEIRPGVRSYRLVKLPTNDPRRIRIGAFERRVHRTLLVLARRIVRHLAAAMASLRRVRARAARLLVRPRRPGWAGISDELPAAQR